MSQFALPEHATLMQTLTWRILNNTLSVEAAREIVLRAASRDKHLIVTTKGATNSPARGASKRLGGF